MNKKDIRIFSENIVKIKLKEIDDFNMMLEINNLIGILSDIKNREKQIKKINRRDDCTRWGTKRVIEMEARQKKKLKKEGILDNLIFNNKINSTFTSKWAEDFNTKLRNITLFDIMDKEVNIELNKTRDLLNDLSCIRISGVKENIRERKKLGKYYKEEQDRLAKEIIDNGFGILVKN